MAVFPPESFVFVRTAPHPLPPAPEQVLLNAVSDAVCSYLLAFFFQSSHNISEVEWPTPDQDNFLGTDWCVCVCVCVCLCVSVCPRRTGAPVEISHCHTGLCCRSRQLRTMPLTAGSGLS